MALPNDIRQQTIIRQSINMPRTGGLPETPQLNVSNVAQVFDLQMLNAFNARMEQHLKALRRQATFLSQPFTTVANTPQLLRERENRTYFLIQNTGANSLFIGFNFQPSTTNGLNLASGAFAEPYQVPTNDIWLNCTLATTGILIYSIGND